MFSFSSFPSRSGDTFKPTNLTCVDGLYPFLLQCMTFAVTKFSKSAPLSGGSKYKWLESSSSTIEALRF